MRYIDPEIVAKALPHDWCEQAQQATDAVAAAQTQNRSKEVNRHSHLWKDLKATLRDVSHEKCWYCESKDVRSDNAVDHFRPKNAVAECAIHEGYWWLAFKWENYRFCCTFCNCRRVDHDTSNTGGKADHFPLRQEDRRAHRPTDSLDDEEPMLLDPCSSSDPGLLWFDEDGQVIPHPVCGGPASYPYQRAQVSIGFYHLNHTDIVEQRKTLCGAIRGRFEDADRYFAKYLSGDGTAQAAFDDAIRDLRQRLAPTAPYSATARAMLMGLRGTYPLVEILLASA